MATMWQPPVDRELADGVHPLDRGDIDAIAVIDAGSAQQERVSPEPGRYLLIHHDVGVSRVVGGPLPRLVTRPAAAG